MIHAQNSKLVSVIKPASVATNGTASGTFSVQNYRYARVILGLDTAASTSNTDVLVRVSEGDTTSAFATAADLAMTTATPDTSNPQLYQWFLDLRKRKKYLKVEYSPSASGARIAYALVDLSRAEQPPPTAAGRGAAAQVIA